MDFNFVVLLPVLSQDLTRVFKNYQLNNQRKEIKICP